MKVRRNQIEERVHEFADVVGYIFERPLLLWCPGIEENVQALIDAVTELREKRAS